MEGTDWDESVILDSIHFRGFTQCDTSLEREILEIFMENAPVYIEELMVSDSSEWEAAAHRLKGAAKIIGAWNLAGEAERAEFLGIVAQDAPERTVIVEELRARLLRLTLYLKGEFLPSLEEQSPESRDSEG